MKESDNKNEMRKKKFLDKMKKFNEEKEENNNISLINGKTPISSNEEPLQETKEIKKSKKNKKKNKSFNNNNKHIDNNINNNFSSSKIDYNGIYLKINKYDYIIKLLNIIKKIIIIILCFLHCLNNSLVNIASIAYTILFLEISWFLINLFFIILKKKITKSIKLKNENINTKKNLNQLDIIYNYLVKNFSSFTNIFIIWNFLIDIIGDISILFIIIIIFFIINEENI